MVIAMVTATVTATTQSVVTEEPRLLLIGPDSPDGCLELLRSGIKLYNLEDWLDCRCTYPVDGDGLLLVFEAGATFKLTAERVDFGKNAMSTRREWGCGRTSF